MIIDTRFKDRNIISATTSQFRGQGVVLLNTVSGSSLALSLKELETLAKSLRNLADEEAVIQNERHTNPRSR